MPFTESPSEAPAAAALLAFDARGEGERGEEERGDGKESEEFHGGMGRMASG